MSKKNKKATEEAQVSINQRELDQLKVLADYTFFDEYQNKCSFPQFEKSLALFFKPEDLSLEEVFKDLCGPKKKYLTFPRLLRAFNTWKTRKVMLKADTRKFFTRFQTRLLYLEDEVILKEKKAHYKSYTSTGNKNRSLLTKLTLVTDKENIIKGMKLQYDDLIDANLYDQSEDVYFGNELEMGVLGEGDQSAKDMKTLTDKSNCNNEFILRDSISHIFGTYTTKIELLGFKTRAGKTYFSGKPNGDGFIFGSPYRQFHYVKFKVGEAEEGMYNFQPFFISNPRYNESLQIKLEDVKPSLWENEPLINEEVALDKVDNPELLEKYIASAPIISDDVGAGDKIKEANELNNLAEITPKEEKQYIAKDKDYDMIKEAAADLKANDIISSNATALRSGNRRGKSKSKSKAKDNKKADKKNKKKKIKAKNVGRGEGKGMSMFANKKNFKQLMNKLNNGIEGDLEQEKKKLKKKKEQQERMRSRSQKEPLQALATAIQSSPQNEEVAEKERESESEPPKLRAGRKKKNVTTTQTVSNGLGNYGSFSNYQNPYGMTYSPYGQAVVYDPFSGYGNAFGPSYAYGPVSTNTGTKTTYYANYTPTQPQKQYTSTNVYDSVEDFFNSFGGNDTSNDVDDILNMSNQDLMKMFYADTTPKQTTPSQPAVKPKQETKKNTKTKIKEDPEADKRAQKNWIKFKDDMTNKKGLKILQGIGAVIRAMVALEQEERGDKTISLTEKIRLLQLLQDNEKILDFLTQERKPVEEVEEEEEEELDLPGLDDIDELDIDDLTGRISRIDELKKETKSDTVNKKLDAMKEAYIAKKNKLIEEEEKRAREEMIKQEKINQEEIKRKEEEKRKKAQEEKNNYLNNLLNNNDPKKIANEETKKKAEEDKKKEEEKKNNRLDNVGFNGTKEKVTQAEKKIVNACTDPNHSYRDQKIPTGSSMFTDPVFPPERNSLCPTKGNQWILPPDGIPEDVDGWENFGWTRIGDIFKNGNYKVFDTDDDGGGKIEDDDIIQGQIGDCYFLSAVASLSNRPDYIDKLFYTKEKSKNGAYGVYYCMNGEWKLVVVDDYFPSTAGRLTKRLAFAGNNGNEFWVGLLEKAWAKINGCYARIGCGGLPHEVFECITEAWSECQRIKMPELVGKRSKDDDPFWAKLMRCQNKKFILTAGTNGTGEAEDMGLVSGHAYSVLGVYEIGTGSNKVRLVKLRNPWGNGEWTGDYSDDSPLWTKDKKAAVGWEKKDDGEFYMTYEDFCHYYGSMGICHFGMKWYYFTKKVSAKKGKGDGDDNTAGRIVDRESGIDGPAITKVNITKGNTDCYFRICQKNPRFKPESEDYHTKCVLQYIMLLDDKFNYIASESNDNTTTCVRHPSLKAGTYYLITDINYRYVGHRHGYVITAYANNPVELQNVSSKGMDLKKIIKNASCQLAEKVFTGEETEGDIDKTLDTLQSYPPKDPKKFGNSVTAYITSSYSNRVPYQIVYFKNHTNQPAKAEIEVKQSGKDGHEIYCDEKIPANSSKFTLEIPAKGQNCVLINKKSMDTRIGLSYGLSYAPKDDDDDSGYDRRAPSSSSSAAKTPDPSDVFQGEPQALDTKGKINQYYKQIPGGYAVGIENGSKNDLKFKLNLTGLQVSTGEFAGKSSCTFPLPANTRRAFNTKAIPGQRQLSFSFDLAK